MKIEGATLLVCMGSCVLVLAEPAVANGAEPSGALRLPPDVARQVMAPVAYAIPGMDRVRIRRDLRYNSTTTPQARMDIYLPSAGGSPRQLPAVFLIHGSTDIRFRPKDWGFFQSWARLIAASGFAAVSFTQDLPPGGAQLSAGSKSVADAIAFAKMHARTLGIDPNRICLAVFSAGGPLISSYLSGADSAVRCIAAYYPLLDLEEGRSFVRHESPEDLSRFSPIRQLKHGGVKVPLLVARGGADDLPGIRSGTDLFIAAALEANWPITLLNHPRGPHGFDNRLHDGRTREIVRMTLAFFRANLTEQELDPSGPPNGRAR